MGYDCGLRSATFEAALPRNFPVRIRPASLLALERCKARVSGSPPFHSPSYVRRCLCGCGTVSLRTHCSSEPVPDAESSCHLLALVGVFAPIWHDSSAPLTPSPACPKVPLDIYLPLYTDHSLDRQWQLQLAGQLVAAAREANDVLQYWR